MTLRLSVWVLSLLLLPSTAVAQVLHGTVTRVVDGDTIYVRNATEEQIKVRVYGINCHERGQPMWAAARDFTRRMVGGKKVKLLTKGTGHYGRTLAFVITADRKSLGLELLRKGLARVYDNDFAPDVPDTYQRYQQAQMAAMALGLGMWEPAGENQ